MCQESVDENLYGQLMRNEATVAHDLFDAFSVFGALGRLCSHEIAGANMCVTELFYQLLALCSLTGGRTTYKSTQRSNNKNLKPTDSEDDLGIADELLDVFSICFAVATFH